MNFPRGFVYFDGYILPDGTHILFEDGDRECAGLIVETITKKDHPAFKGDHQARRLVTLHPIEKNTRIGLYAGRVISDKDADKNWSDYYMTPCEDEPWVVDAAQIGNKMRFINDYRSMENDVQPNVVFLMAHERVGEYGVTVVIALRDISPGEEILADYGDSYWDTVKEKKPHKEIARSCDLCFESFDSIENLREHQSQCGKTNRKKRKKNNDSKHKLEFHYSLCNLTVGNRSSYQRHLKSAFHIECEESQGQIRQFFQCDVCRRRYKSQERFLRHKNEFHLGLEYHCGLCASFFKTLDELDVHVEKQHVDEYTIYPPYCEICPRRYSTIKGLITHMWKHRTKEN